MPGKYINIFFLLSCSRTLLKLIKHILKASKLWRCDVIVDSSCNKRKTFFFFLPQLHIRLELYVYRVSYSDRTSEAMYTGDFKNVMTALYCSAEIYLYIFIEELLKRFSADQWPGARVGSLHRPVPLFILEYKRCRLVLFIPVCLCFVCDQGLIGKFLQGVFFLTFPFFL